MTVWKLAESGKTVLLGPEISATGSKRKIETNISKNLDSLTVYDHWPKLPSADRVFCRLLKQRWARDIADLGDFTCFVDQDFNANDTGCTG